MKNIDIKSVIIGILLTSTVFFGLGATGKGELKGGQWNIGHAPISTLYERPNNPSSKGEKFKNHLNQEPFAVSGDGKTVFTRVRTK